MNGGTKTMRPPLSLSQDEEVSVDDSRWQDQVQKVFDCLIYIHEFQI